MIKNKLTIIKSKFFLFSFFLIFFWLLKNFLISGCLIYPIKHTCFNNLAWFGTSTENESINGEAWSKAWPDRENNNLSQTKYIKNFNWVSTWSKNHLLIIIEKITPIIAFIFINILFLYFAKCLKKNKPLEYENAFIYILIINFLFLVLWFIKFPLYRFGYSIIFICLISLSYFIFIRYINFRKLYKFKHFFIIFLIIFTTAVIGKNINRIFINLSKPIIPSIFDNINEKSLKVFNNEGTFTHYTKANGGLCGYSRSPCTHLAISDLAIKKIFGYTIYYRY
jgi:hypothetical protein